MLKVEIKKNIVISPEWFGVISVIIGLGMVLFAFTVGNYIRGVCNRK